MKTTYAEEEPLEIVGHLEDLAAGVVCDGEDKLSAVAEGNYAVTNMGKQSCTRLRPSQTLLSFW